VKIVITNHESRLNKGNQALLTSRVRTLRELIPAAEFTVFSYYPEIENELQDVKILEVLGRISLPRSAKKFKKDVQTVISLARCALWSVLHRCFHWNVKPLINNDGLKEYYQADLIISTGGDILTESYTTQGFLQSVLNYLFALLLEKPVVLYAESIGPFKRWWNTAIAKFFLNRVTLIMLREEISKGYLDCLRINTPMHVTADSAFLLEPASPQRVNEILVQEGMDAAAGRTLVGLSLSASISHYGFDNEYARKENYQEYKKSMAQLADYLIHTLNATILLVPHVTGPGDNDDRIAADDMCALIKNKQHIVSIKNQHTAEETKGIIGMCDLFIAARMHAAIAAVSMHVPTVAIAYSHKTHGIVAKMLDCGDYVLDIEDINYEDLTSVVSKAWKSREEIKKQLESIMGDIKQRAMKNAVLVKELIER